jgi:quinol monooxygenase YgiN
VFVRTTTFQARPEMVEAGITYVRDAVIPMVERIRGCVGQSMLVDRERGRCIVTAAWQSYRLMDANTGRVQPMRDQASEILGGAELLQEEWEIAVLHRDHPSHPGACARVTWMRAEPDRLDDAVRSYRTAMLPAAEREPGFCSASLFVDRSTSRLVSTVTYDSRDALRRTREPAVPAPHNGSPPSLLEILDTGEFELVLAHLHVPELD